MRACLRRSDSRLRLPADFQPRMIGLRPTLSESQPKKMKKGVARASATATMMLDRFKSTFRTV